MIFGERAFKVAIKFKFNLKVIRWGVPGWLRH